MNTLFLSKQANRQHFDLQKVDVLIEKSGINNFPESFCIAKKDVAEVVDYLLLQLIRNIINECHSGIDPTEINAKQNVGKLKFDWFDSLELLAKIEIAFGYDLFPKDLENEDFTFGQVMSYIKEHLH